MADATPYPDLAHGLKVLEDTHDDYAHAQEQYDGTAEELFFSPRLSRLFGRQAGAFRVNFASKPVDVVADRQHVSAITGATEAQTRALAERFIEPNDLEAELDDLWRERAKLGDYYVMVWPGDTEAGEPEWVATPIDPRQGRMVYDPRTKREKRYFVEQWKDGDSTYADVVYDDRVEHFISDKGGTWQRYEVEVDGEVEVPAIEPHDFGELPVWHFRNGRPYGTPEHYRMFGAQDGLNKLLPMLVYTNDYQGAPQRYGLLEPDVTAGDDLLGFGDELDGGVPGGTAERTPDQSTSDLKSEPGGMWLLRGLSGVGEFSPVNPKAFLDPATWLVRAGSSLTSTPLHHFDPTGDVPSGESLRAADAPLVKKVSKLQRLDTRELEDMLGFVLRQLGFSDGRVTITWSPAEHADDLYTWQLVQQKVLAGVPVKRALVEVGVYDETTVDAWLAGSEDDNLARRLGLLDQVSKAMQQLASAAALGVLDPGFVQQVVEAIVPDLELSTESTGPSPAALAAAATRQVVPITEEVSVEVQPGDDAAAVGSGD